MFNSKIPKWLIGLAEYEAAGKTMKLSEAQELVNYMATVNNIDKPIPPSEIGISIIMELCRDDYDKNLLIAWQQYEQAYRCMHITVKTFNTELPPAEESMVVNVYNALTFFKLTHLLTDGLDERTLTYLEEIRQKEK
jgi:hypothetical protein